MRKRTLNIIIFFAASLQSGAQDKVALLPKSQHIFVVVAHRGDHTHAPENTLTAYENAIRAEVDYVEIDLRTTKDSQLVIMHDASVDRMTNGKGLVKDLTLEEIRKLKVKDKMHAEIGEYLVPTFREVLELCRNKINIYLDFKNADAGLAYMQLREYGMEKQVVVYINEEKQFYQWRQVAPEIPLMLSLPDDVRDEQGVKSFLDKTNVSILDGNHSQYTSGMVKAAKGMECVVLPDIQQRNEDPALWESAIQKGVYGLQTDHPAALINYLIERKLH